MPGLYPVMEEDDRHRKWQATLACVGKNRKSHEGKDKKLKGGKKKKTRGLWRIGKRRSSLGRSQVRQKNKWWNRRPPGSK